MDGLYLVMDMKVNIRLAAELERERLETARDLGRPTAMARHTKECQTPRAEVGLLSPPVADFLIQQLLLFSKREDGRNSYTESVGMFKGS